MGFFNSADLVSLPQVSLIPKCGACGLYKTCNSPKMEPSGKGKKDILIFGEAPGENEDKYGTQFVGESGRLLDECLSIAGIDMRRDCILSNTLICRPPDNRTPTEKQISYCLPNAVKLIQEMKPKIILLFGGPAVKSVIGHIWHDDTRGIARWVGFIIPSQKYNTWISANYHPAHILRLKNDKKQETYDLAKKLLIRNLKPIASLTRRPWDVVPDYRKQVQVEMDDRLAAKAIRRIYQNARSVAFDYETNMLKPESDHARIIGCSISDGKLSVAYPWIGEAIKATKEMIQSDVPKIGSNIIFEERWTLAMLNCKVNKWLWDDTLGAHAIDSRAGIAGLKFQSFMRLGVESYDNHIKPYLRAKGGNQQNQIDRIDLRQLLLYCGLDSLFEHMVAYLQMKEVGYEESYAM